MQYNEKENFWYISQKNIVLNLFKHSDVLFLHCSTPDDSFKIELDLSHFDKLVSYKTARHAINYATKHQNALSCPSQLPVTAEEDIFFIDTETTGLGLNDEICEIAIVDINENIVFESFVKPTIPISSQATKIHGITNSMVATSPTILDIYSQIFDILHLNKNKLVFYNAVFDVRMINQSFKAHDTYIDELNAHCLMLEYAEHWGEYSDYHQGYKWQILVNACNKQGIKIDDVPNHRASGDAIKTSRLYKKVYYSKVNNNE